MHLLTNWQDQGPLIDVAVHFGSLFAVLIYFWRDVVMLLKALGDLLMARLTPAARLLLYLIGASIPLMVVGFLVFTTGAYEHLRTLEVIATANIIFALVLWWCDNNPPARRRFQEITWRDALIVGGSQVLAIIPGVSRSGITISAARFLEFERTEAARFSMILAIPAVLGLGTGAMLKVFDSGDAALQADAIFVFVLSFFTALFAIWFLMALLRHMTMLPFVLYRLLLGVFLLGIVYL